MLIRAREQEEERRSPARGSRTRAKERIPAVAEERTRVAAEAGIRIAEEVVAARRRAVEAAEARKIAEPGVEERTAAAAVAAGGCTLVDRGRGKERKVVDAAAVAVGTAEAGTKAAPTLEGPPAGRCAWPRGRWWESRKLRERKERGEEAGRRSRSRSSVRATERPTTERRDSPRTTKAARHK